MAPENMEVKRHPLNSEPMDDVSSALERSRESSTNPVISCIALLPFIQERSKLTEESPSMAQVKYKEPEDLEEYINAVRELLLTDKALNVPTDRAFILRFLRSMKYDSEGTFRLIQNHYRLEIEYPEIYKKKCASELLSTYENNQITFLPHRDHHGRPIFVSKTGIWNPNVCSLYEMARSFQLCIDMITSDEDVQKSGVVIISDWKGCTWDKLKYCTITNIKMGVKIIQESSPARFVAFHFINHSAILQIILSVAKPFLHEGLTKRMFFHGTNWESLHQHIRPEDLPEDYGGTQPPIDNSDFVKKIVAYDKVFIENTNYGYNKLDS